MNLDKNNFDSLYPTIVNQIKECDLVAFDLEYSGIKLRDQSSYSLFDTMEDRYQHIKSCSQSFTAFQLGIVLYTRRINEKTILINNCSKFSSITYNINLFPTGSDLFDATFKCSAAALKFLRNHSLNFNDVIDNGVGFLNNEEFLQLKTKLDSYSNIHNVLTEDHERVLEQQRKMIGEWLTDKIKLEEIRGEIREDEICQMYLPCINNLLPYFHQLFLRSHFTDIWTTTTNDGKILVQRVNATQRYELDQKEEELSPTSEKYKFCISMLGVSKIWKLISRLKKPIVGHNCLFDLITIYQKFFAPLPDTFEEFRFELNKVLPTIFDTKFIMGRMRMTFKELAMITGGLESTYLALHDLNQSNKDLFVNIEEEPSYNITCDNKRSSQAHEAGYDSFMTGSCLIYLANILYRSQLLDSTDHSKPRPEKSEIGSYEKTSVKSGIITVASFETYENCLKSWKNYVNVIRAHEFCVCFDHINMDDGFRTADGNRLKNTRPPWLIIYDRNPSSELLSINDDIADENVLTEEDDGSSNVESNGEIYFSQAFLEQLLFEFGDANVKKFGKIVDDEKHQKFMVALPSYNITRSFVKTVKKRWPRLVVREYNKLLDDALTRKCFLGLTTLSTVLSAWSIFSLIKEFKLY